MGQRSQIYVRWTKGNGEKVLIARYFQWNFSERMISRAANLIGVLKENFLFSFQFDTSEFVKKIERFCDINFDYRDIVFSSDIVKEYDKFGDGIGFKPYVFLGQDNNDGKLFIDVDPKKGIIKYCLTDEDAKIMFDCREYMDWNYPLWKNDIDGRLYLATYDNFEYIEKNAVLMTRDELDAFMNYDYKR